MYCNNNTYVYKKIEKNIYKYLKKDWTIMNGRFKKEKSKKWYRKGFYR